MQMHMSSHFDPNAFVIGSHEFEIMAGAAAAAIAMEETAEDTFGPQREWKERVK